MKVRMLMRRVPLCVMAGWCFASAGASAYGDQEAFAATVAFQSEDEKFRAALDGMLDRLKTGGDARVLRNGFNLPLLAELDEQFKRPEVQAALGANKGSIAVIFPELGEPYRGIFAKIIEGIEERAKMKVRRYPIGANPEAADLNLQFKRDGVKVAIALGRQGLKAASGLSRDIAVVVGGVLVPPEAENRNLSGISLTPDPALLFVRLKNLMPGIRRVIVVYDPQQNDWLIKLAREAAKAHGLEMVEYQARDLGLAARLYETAFAAADGRRDAVWLPQDATTVEESTILPLVLRESWNRGVPIFSSNFLHVKKGALFALYPNNRELGRTLANSALGALAGEARKQGVAPLREVQVAVNLRTASHFGLNIGFEQQRTFDFVFPEP